MVGKVEGGGDVGRRLVEDRTVVMCLRGPPPLGHRPAVCATRESKEPVMRNFMTDGGRAIGAGNEESEIGGLLGKLLKKEREQNV